MAKLIDNRGCGYDVTDFDPAAHYSQDGNIIIVIENDQRGEPMLFLSFSPLEAKSQIESIEKALIDASKELNDFLNNRKLIA